MSLILDALNKADQERSEQHEVPNLRAIHGSPYPQARPDFLKRWWVEIVFIALLVIAYLGYQLLVDDDPQPHPAMAQAPVAPLQQIVTQPSSPAPARAATPLPAIPAPDTVTAPAAAAVESPVVDIAKPVASPGPSPANSSAELSMDTQRDVKLLYAQQGSVVVSTKPAAQPANSAPAAPPEPKPPQQQSTNTLSELKARLEKLPLLSELSPQKQQQIPSIDFSLHVYSSDQGKGFVTLNGQRRRTGDQVAPGLRLENIVDEFIVLSYQGSKFRLLSLNSWINLQ